MSGPSSSVSLVSVIIPAYNAARYLRETLGSVRAQTYRDFEIIVVDDGSTDETAQIAQSGDDVLYERQDNQGCGPARNRGAELARGNFLSFLDADDLWPADKLSKQVTAYNALPRSQSPLVVYAHARQFFSPELDAETFANIRLPEYSQPAYVPGTLLVTPADFFTIGPYSAALGEGIDWYVRATEAGAQIHMLPDIMLFRRIHDRNMGRAQDLDRRPYAHTLKAMLDRRRQRASEEEL